MKTFFKIVFWSIAVLVGFYFISRLGNSNSSSSGSSPATYSNTDNSVGNPEDSVLSYDEAIDSYWDDIKSYVSGTEIIEACSDSSGNCYDLDVDISEGNIETLHFNNGGYLNFNDEFDSNGYVSATDEEGNGWQFTLDMTSSIVTDAVDNWASDNNYTIE